MLARRMSAWGHPISNLGAQSSAFFLIALTALGMVALGGFTGWRQRGRQS